MSEMSREDALAHFGVKGMKWGVRNENRARLRALNKESRARDSAARREAIDAARGRVASGQTARELKEARQKYKADKKVIGSREAKKSLREAKKKYYDEVEMANTAKNGQEVAAQLIADYAAYRLFNT